MSENINPKIQSAKDAMIAEVIIGEIMKLTDLYSKSEENNQKLDTNYLEVKRLIEEQKKFLIGFKDYVDKNNNFILQFARMTNTAISLTEDLKAMGLKGIHVSESSKKDFLNSIIKENRIIKGYIQCIFYSIGLCFLLVLLVIIFMFF